MQIGRVINSPIQYLGESSRRILSSCRYTQIKNTFTNLRRPTRINPSLSFFNAFVKKGFSTWEATQLTG